jgi:hypothetical protein
MAFELELSVFAGQERGARQAHREGAEAVGAAAVGAAGKVKGPFWPQPARQSAHAPASKGVTTRRTKLI